MDTKRLVIAMTFAMAVVVGWQLLITKLYPPKPAAPATVSSAATQPSQAVEPATQPGIAPGASAGAAPTTSESQQRLESPSTGGWHIVAAAAAAADNAPAEPVTLGSARPDDERFAMAVQLSPYGAGIESVVLNKYRQSRQSEDRYTFQQPYPIEPRLTQPLTTRSVSVEGDTFDLGQVAWELDEHSADEATWHIDIADAGGPVLRVRKHFKLSPRSNDPNAPQGYELAVDYSLENLTDRSLTAQTSFSGPTTPPKELDRGPDRDVILAYVEESQTKLSHHPVDQFQKDKVTQQLIQAGQPMLWGGASGAYFAALVLPRPIEGRTEPYIESMHATALNPSAPADERHVAVVFQTTALTLDAGQTKTMPLEVFFGPKSRSLLKTPYYASAPRNFDQVIVTPGSCAICTFQWLVNALVWLLQGFHMIFQDWGLAIIGLVVLVRVILHPITKRSTINMSKMSKMGPEMERLKKKYGDNKDELNKAMMSLYKEQGFTPILGCLPMFLQMPIWIALWTSLQSTFELRQEPFLWGWTWIDDLARPDALLTFAPVHLPLGITIRALNMLPVLLGVVFFLQQKYTPKPAAATKEQEQQQKMMQWMSLLFPLFLYNGPSGLNLYILTSTTIGIFEMRIIRKHIREQEEREKAGPIIVDAPDDGRPRSRDRKKDDKSEPAKKGGLARWLADLQQRAEEVRRNAEKRKP